jgi:hypothetical protein
LSKSLSLILVVKSYHVKFFHITQSKIVVRPSLWKNFGIVLYWSNQYNWVLLSNLCNLNQCLISQVRFKLGVGSLCLYLQQMLHWWELDSFQWFPICNRICFCPQSPHESGRLATFQKLSFQVFTHRQMLSMLKQKTHAKK